MSAESGRSGQILSLPQGGGALQGIGESFSPDLFTGTANFTIPLNVPAGRNGLQPSLALQYSSGNGNGPFGLGWQLSVPGISRRTDKGVPRYDDTRDTFLLSGAENLIPIDGDTTAGMRYRPRTEGLFAEIWHIRDTANDYWRVRTKDGLTSFYGTPRPTDAGPSWYDPAVMTDPDDPRRIFAWKLSLTIDRFGNRIEYQYVRDTARADGPHRWDQLYLAKVQYLDHGPLEAPAFLVSVAFTYAARPDPYSEYRAGFEIRTVQRCTDIAIATHAGADRAVRTYHLEYLDERSPAPARLPHNRVSLLNQIRLTGHDGTLSEQLPPLELGYSIFAPEQRHYQPIAVNTGALPERGLHDQEYELVDLFGNGLPSILHLNGTARYWRNQGGGHFAAPRLMREAPAGAPLSSPGVQIADMDGDGRADLLVTDGVRGGYYPLTFQGGWDRRSFVQYRQAPTMNLADPNVRLIDLDGDGVIDALRLGQDLELYYNDRRTGWRAAERHARGGTRFPDVVLSDPRVRLADMTGDGLQDIVLIHNGRVDYWPYRGYGRWGERITMSHSLHFADPAYGTLGYDPRRLLLGDIDGDGCADLVYVGTQQVTVWINQGGNGWSAPIVIPGTPAMTDRDAVRLVDLHGTGTAGILWTYDAGTYRDSTYKFLDLTGGVKPYLLNRIDNHIGALTLVDYAASTRFYLEDERNPTTRWQTPLPFPVQVIARVEVIDAISGNQRTTEYRYHHGYWDGVEREFRGFGRVDQRDTETFAGAPAVTDGNAAQPFAPPTETRTWFHLGPVGGASGDWQELTFQGEFWQGDRPLFARPAAVQSFLATLAPSARRDAVRAMRGRVLRTELYAYDGTARQDRPYTVVEHLHGVTSVPIGAAWPGAGEPWRQQVFFPFTLAQRTTQWERGDDPLTQVTFTDGYDAYGQPRQQTSVGLPRRIRSRQPRIGASIGAVLVDEPAILVTHARTEYATPDQSLYLFDRVAQSRSFELTAPPTVSESAPDNLTQVLADQIAAAWSVHRQFGALLDGWSANQPLPAGVRLIGHTINYYDGPINDGQTPLGRPAGQVGPYGVLVRSEALAFAGQELDAAYGDRRPVYLGGGASLPPGAPAITAQGLGYRQTTIPGGQTGYYVTTQHQRFDFHSASAPQRRGALLGVRDPLGAETTIALDSYWLLPVLTRDPAGLETRAENDYRLLHPATIIDPNGTTSHMRYTPLGLPHVMFVQGQQGEGGNAERPTVEWVYDLFAYERTRGQATPQPIFGHTRRRIWHASDQRSDEVIELREYSDGFNRLIQTRAQAETLTFGATGDDVGLGLDPGSVRGPAQGQRVTDRVVVSGWQVYDNKGRVIEQYEPFFASSWAYQPEPEARRGQHATLFYDPRGQLIRTIRPDGGQQRVIFGVPANLADPEHFAPTPWESYIYDANDLAPLSDDPTAPANAPRSLSDRAPTPHHFTPASGIIDALGRGICQIARNGPTPATDWLLTRSRYDIRGNLLVITDALGRPAFRHAYDLLNRSLRVESIDAGLRTTVLDAMGKPVEYRDSKGSLILHQYDLLRRPASIWARNTATDPLTLRERLIYGDGGAADQPDAERRMARASYSLGRLVRQYDEAGRLDYHGYDFQGHLLEKTRLAISDTALAGGWNANWSDAAAESALDPAPYQTGMRYDALGRVITLIAPADLNGQRATLTPAYNRAGALERVELDGQPFVTQITYNARRQRVLIAYGNGVMTRYAYDPRSFRLARLRSERSSRPAPDTWQGTGAPLQELSYRYDLVGNITAIEDRTPGSGIAGSPDGRDRLVRRFVYDALYRLIEADGRACKDIAAPRPIEDLAVCGSYQGGPATPNQDNAPDLTERYSETYRYDLLGNLLGQSYQATSRWTRTCTIDPGSNRLQRIETGSSYSVALDYDPNGNLRRQNTERHLGWDQADRLIGYRNQPEGAPTPSIEARYLYDSGGQRIKKWVRTGGAGNVESTIYIDGLFEQRAWNANGPQRNTTIHVMDNQQRIALVRRGPAAPDDAGPAIQYHLGDHLSSSSLVIDAGGAWINREEYSPYGETLFGGFARKRYRFTGKERDAESGLYYHGARYYAPWMARWISCDPAGTVDGLNVYAYVRSNPLRFYDHNGLTGTDTTTTTAASPAPATPASGEIGHVASYSKQPNALYDAAGKIASEDEHVIPRGKQEALTHNRGTGSSDYTNSHYRKNTTVRVERATALNKTHGNRGGPTADNVGTERLKQKVANSEPINYREEVFNESLDNAKRATRATGSRVTDAQLNRAALAQDGELFGIQRINETGSKIGATAAEVDTAIESLAFEAPARPSLASKAAGGAAKGLNVLGSAYGGYSVGTGIDKISQGHVGQGIVDVAEGSANLGLSIGSTIAVKTGVVVAEAGVAAGTATFAVGVAAGVSVGIAAESARAAINGEQTPIDIADKYYGTHFGDIYGWVTGQYSR